ncbi:MAG: DUF411 domain-containing protein [Vicinamibacterales bacterium]
MDTQIDRRTLLLGLCGTAASLFSLPQPVAGQPQPTMTVYKDPSCACCQEWVNHATVHGYRATVVKADMGPIKLKHRIPPTLQSCHTTLIAGYVVEGHVPAQDIARLLKEKPKGILGLTIPNMPQSAPGMDLLPFQPFTVLTFDAKGQTTVWAKHTKPA